MGELINGSANTDRTADSFKKVWKFPSYATVSTQFFLNNRHRLLLFSPFIYCLSLFSEFSGVKRSNDILIEIMLITKNYINQGRIQTSNSA